MATQEILPENDQDLLLAQSLGKVLDEESSFADMGNDLVDQLLEFKTGEQSELGTTPSSSASIWAAIEAETTKKQKTANVLPFFQRTTTFAWASAAVLLIAAFIGFYWINFGTEPTLVAQTDSTIEVVVLKDGTEITLRPFSELYEVTLSETERTYSITGEGYFDVQSDPNRPFSVTAGDAVVTVLGTKFNLSSWGAKAQVYLDEGSVRFSATDIGSVILEPGQTSIITNGTISLPVNSEPDQYIDWISNVIIFNASSPEEVVAEISQHFNINISISSLENRTGIDGSLQLGSPDQTLEDLGLVLNGTFRKVSQDEYTFISLE